MLRGCRSGHIQHWQALRRTVIRTNSGRDEYLQIGFDRKEQTEVFSRLSCRNRKCVQEIVTLLLQTNAPELPEAQTIPASLDKQTNYAGTALAASCQSPTALENCCTNAAVPSQRSRGSNKSSVNITSQHAPAPSLCSDQEGAPCSLL